MKPASVKFYHVTGRSAYLIFWKQRFNCQISLEGVESFYVNLELIVKEDRSLVAFRSEVPEELQWLFENLDDREWQSHDPEICKSINWAGSALKSLLG